MGDHDVGATVSGARTCGMSSSIVCIETRGGGVLQEPNWGETSAFARPGVIFRVGASQRGVALYVKHGTKTKAVPPRPENSAAPPDQPKQSKEK